MCWCWRWFSPLLWRVLTLGKSVASRMRRLRKAIKRGKNYYGFCMFCHGKNGKGTVLDKGGRWLRLLLDPREFWGEKTLC